jgi:replication-associated recombination protein RarA
MASMFCRFNKAQQDTFLPYVEAGHIVLIGATTENPSFEINAALLSRCRVLMLNKLQPDHIRKLLERAILDREKGVLLSIKGGSRGDAVRIEEDALRFLSHAADGDARVALNSLEIAGMAAFAAWESNLQRPQMDEWCSSTQCEAVQKTDMEREGLPEVSGLKREGSSSALVGMVTNTWVERSGSGFGIKRLEVLKESLRKDNLQNSPDDYTRPFKRFKGGKEVTAQIVVKDRESTSSSGGSGGETEKDTVGAPTTTLREIGGELARELRDKDGNGMIGSENKGTLGAVGTEAHGSNGSSSGAGKKEKKVIVVTLQLVKDALQRSHVLYDKTGDEHYNIISALHKSMRGGDADAAIYWLARMLEGGEGPLYVARRLVRFASEDIGIADPQALVLAVACYQACHFLGMPECNVNLAQCVVYLSLAQKSVIVYNAIVAAQRLVREGEQNEPVPLHLRNAPTQLMKDLGYSKGYIYPPNHVGPVEQEYLPPSLRGHKFLQWDKEGADH